MFVFLFLALTNDVSPLMLENTQDMAIDSSVAGPPEAIPINDVEMEEGIIQLLML